MLVHGLLYRHFTPQRHVSGDRRGDVHRLSRRRDDLWNIWHDVSVLGQVRARRVGDLRTLPAPDRFRKWHRGLRGRVRSSRLQGRRRCRAVQVPRPPERGCGLDVKRDRISHDWSGVIGLLSSSPNNGPRSARPRTLVIQRGGFDSTIDALHSHASTPSRPSCRRQLNTTHRRYLVSFRLPLTRAIEIASSE